MADSKNKDTESHSIGMYLYVSLVIHILGWVQQKRPQGDTLIV